MNEIGRDDVAAAARSKSACSVNARLRAGLACGVAASVLMALAGSADAAVSAKKPGLNAAGARHGSRTAAKAEAPKPLSVPIIAVSIASQRLTVYDKGQAVATAPVSTGTPGHPTPTGIFSVIQKQKIHFSNLYNAAPMPYMQRITWSGVALHAGPLPGFAASHGCIRLPHEFAVRLWSMTRMGARVIVARNEVAPQEISHPHLFVLKKAAELSRLDPSHIVVAEGDSPVVSDAVSSSAITPAETPVPAAETPAPAAPASVVVETPAPVSDAPVKAAETVEPPATTTTIQPPKAAESSEVPELRTGTIMPSPTATPVETPAEPPKAAEAPKSSEAPKTTEAPATVEAPKAAQTPPPVETPKAAETPAPAVPAAPKLAERPLRSGPISVFVSRKEGKLYVRKGFEPVFDMPVTIANAGTAIGNHVFTAGELAEDGAHFHWLVVSMSPPAHAAEAKKPAGHKLAKSATKSVKPAEPVALPPPVNAAEALDRIEFPAEALERISQLMSPGASLIISDQGLGPETGKETDFIVLTR